MDFFDPINFLFLIKFQFQILRKINYVMKLRRWTNLCQGAGFVTENVLNLTEFLVQSGGTGFGGDVFEHHFLIPVDPETVREPNDFHTTSII